MRVRISPRKPDPLPVPRPEGDQHSRLQPVGPRPDRHREVHHLPGRSQSTFGTFPSRLSSRSDRPRRTDDLSPSRSDNNSLRSTPQRSFVLLSGKRSYIKSKKSGGNIRDNFKIGFGEKYKRNKIITNNLTLVDYSRYKKIKNTKKVPKAYICDQH